MGHHSTSLDYIQSELDNPIYAAGHPRITSNPKPHGLGCQSSPISKEMEIYPKSSTAIERYLMTSITVALTTILIFGASERGVISSYTKKWNETEMTTVIYVMIAFVALCAIRGIYLLIKSKMNGLFYIIGIPLGLLTLLELGTVVE